jgi:hypothetical protein
MERLVATTKFFQLLQSEKDIQPSIWMKAYNDFVTELFVENDPVTNKTDYHNMLIYTSVELVSLTDVSEKKCSKIPTKGH